MASLCVAVFSSQDVGIHVPVFCLMCHQTLPLGCNDSGPSLGSTTYNRESLDLSAVTDID